MLNVKKMIDEWKISEEEIAESMEGGQKFFDAVKGTSLEQTEEKKLMYAVKSVVNERIKQKIKNIRRNEKLAMFISFAITFFAVLLQQGIALAILAACVAMVIFKVLMVLLVRPEWYDSTYYSEIDTLSYADAYYEEVKPI